MEKAFEDVFAEIQTDMVEICLEYVENNADNIYIYSSFEANTIVCDFFYKIGDKIVERHKLNTIKGRDYDVSIERQSACMDILNEDIKKIIRLFALENREMPTEIKIIYDVENNNLSVDYQYDMMYSNSPEKMACDISDEWFDELQHKQYNTR